MAIDSNNWMEEGSCVGKGNDIFFSDSAFAVMNRKNTARAKALCKTCPVNAECLSYAFNNKELFGIWGSFSAKERASMYKIFNVERISKQQAEQIVNKSVSEIKSTFKNIIFMEDNNEQQK